ncbi:MAG: DUF1571 domain-containing protein [bacterium]
MRFSFRKFSLCLFLVAFLSTAFLPAFAQDEERLDIQNALKIVEIMENTYEDVQDYSVITYKQERHGGELMAREKIFTKFRKPFSVYMKWVKDDPPEHKNPNLGQEMIFEKGWNNNKIYAHLGKRSYFPAWVTSASSWVIDYTALDPKGRVATMYQRHTIDEVPFGETIKRISKAVRAGIKYPEDNVYFTNLGYKEVFGEPSGCIEGHLPGGKREAYYDDRIMVCIGLRTNMPTQIKVRNDEGTVLENYRMDEITLNPGYDTEDFRPSNSEYNFQ